MRKGEMFALEEVPGPAVFDKAGLDVVVEYENNFMFLLDSDQQGALRGLLEIIIEEGKESDKKIFTLLKLIGAEGRQKLMRALMSERESLRQISLCHTNAALHILEMIQGGRDGKKY